MCEGRYESKVSLCASWGVTATKQADGEHSRYVQGSAQVLRRIARTEGERAKQHVAHANGQRAGARGSAQRTSKSHTQATG